MRPAFCAISMKLNTMLGSRCSAAASTSIRIARCWCALSLTPVGDVRSTQALWVTSTARNYWKMGILWPFLISSTSNILCHCKEILITWAWLPIRSVYITACRLMARPFRWFRLKNFVNLQTLLPRLCIGKKCSKQYAMCAELSVSIQGILWHALRRCAHNGYRRRHDVFEVFSFQLLRYVYTQHQNEQDIDQPKKRRSSTYRSEQGRASDNDCVHHTTWWPNSLRFIWRGHPFHDLNRWLVCQTQPKPCTRPHKCLLQTSKSAFQWVSRSPLGASRRAISDVCNNSWSHLWDSRYQLYPNKSDV